MSVVVFKLSTHPTDPPSKVQAVVSICSLCVLTSVTTPRHPELLQPLAQYRQEVIKTGEIYVNATPP